MHLDVKCLVLYFLCYFSDTWVFLLLSYHAMWLSCQTMTFCFTVYIGVVLPRLLEVCLTRQIMKKVLVIVLLSQNLPVF